jgi:hypothetical protein
MSLFTKLFTTRRMLQLSLVVAGAASGAVFGVILTRLGKIAAGAPPATLDNYLWNAAVFGVMAGVLSPLITWSALRRAPHPQATYTLERGDGMPLLKDS